MNKLAEQITQWRIRKGFHTPSTINLGNDGDLMLGKLMLVVSEVGEAAEAIRHNDEKNFKEELADTIIRILDICGAIHIDIDKEVEEKMKVNEGRPIRHGKVCSI
jgi:hypothetical protein